MKVYIVLDCNNNVVKVTTNKAKAEETRKELQTCYNHGDGYDTAKLKEGELEEE